LDLPQELRDRQKREIKPSRFQDRVANADRGQVIGRPALWRQTHEPNQGARNGPVSTKAMPPCLARERDRSDTDRLEAADANVFVGRYTEPAPEAIRGASKQGGRTGKRKVLTLPSDGLLHE